MWDNTKSNIAGKLKLHVLMAGLALLPVVATAAEPEPRTFRDWMAGCDNVKRCTALSLPAKEPPPLAYLRLERAASPGAVTELVLRLRGEWESPPRALQLKLDGEAFPVSGRFVPTGGDGDLLSLTFRPQEAAALIEAARKAARLTVSGPNLTAHISLSGAVAAMLWIDEQQGRLDTRSALIRKGSRKQASAALALPVVSAKPASGTLSEEAAKALAASLRAQIKQRDSDLCEDDEPLVASDQAWSLDGARRLVGLGCSRGAYNLTTGFWLVERDDVAAAKPVIFPQGEGDQNNMLTNADFDQKTGLITFFSKGRGLGDCGEMGGYAWTGSGFVQSELSVMGECRGIGSEDWITQYRSTAK